MTANKLTVKILETERTILREIVAGDAAFILDLLNQPSFIRFIGDRNVRNVEQAREYIESRFAAHYQKHGYGFYTIELKDGGTPIGICGFVKRDTLPDADVGFALLPQFERQGYGFETASAVMRYGRDALNLPRVLAIVSIDNDSSQKLLERIGLKYERLIRLADDAEELKLFSSNSR